MEMKPILDEVKTVLTPAAKGALEAIFEKFSAPKSAGRTLAMIVAVGIGAAIGAGAAILLTPINGKEARGKLTEVTSKLKMFRSKGSGGESDKDATDGKPAKPNGKKQRAGIGG